MDKLRTKVEELSKCFLEIARQSMAAYEDVGHARFLVAKERLRWINYEILNLDSVFENGFLSPYEKILTEEFRELRQTLSKPQLYEDLLNQR